MSDIAASSDGTARQINWYRVPLAKEKLRELTQRSNWKGFLQLFFCRLASITTATTMIVPFTICCQ